MSKPNETLADFNKQIHSDPNKWVGEFLSEFHAERIGKLLQKFSCSTVLDYGCGKGQQYHQAKIHDRFFGGIMPALYDIGVPGIDKLPDGTFDAVISTDVLEHIPEEDLDHVIAEIYSKANKVVYLNICNSLAATLLPDGRNSHLTVQRPTWWLNKIRPLATRHTIMHVTGSLGVMDAEFDASGLKSLPHTYTTVGYRRIHPNYGD